MTAGTSFHEASFLVAGRAAFSSATQWRLTLALYGPVACLALLGALPVFFGSVVVARAGDHWLREVADGGYANVLLEMTASVAGLTVLDAGPVDELDQAVAGVSISTLLLVLAVPLQGLSYTFLSGGVLDRLTETPRLPFLSACRAWFWPMFRLGLVALAIVLTLGSMGTLAVLRLPADGLVGGLVKVVLASLWVSSVNGLLELARADMVVRSDHRALHAVGRAFGSLVRPGQLAAALGWWAILGAAGLLLVSLTVATLVFIPALAVVASFAAQQVLALVGAWLKVFRLSIAARLAQGEVREGAARVVG